MTAEHDLLDAARNGGQGAFAWLVGPYLAQPRAWCHRIDGPSADPDGEVARNREVTWLQPFPSDPASIVETRATMRLALVAAFQHLPPRQRAVLILRDVLEWRAAEVAHLLDMSTTVVNSALQRAQAQLPVVPDDVAEPSGPKRRALLDRCVTAFETADVNGLAVILTEDASGEMPPIPTWSADRDTVAAFLAGRQRMIGGMPAIPTTANGQPAFAFYARHAEGGSRPHALHVLTLTKAGISGIVSFQDPKLFPLFGPATRGQQLAKLLARRGQFPAARQLADEALELVSPTSWAVVRAEILMAKAEVNLLAGASGRAEASLRAALRIYEDRHTAPPAEQVRDALASFDTHSETNPA